MTDDTKILYKDYTEEEPYEGDCCPSQLLDLRKRSWNNFTRICPQPSVSLMRAHGGKY